MARPPTLLAGVLSRCPQLKAIDFADNNSEGFLSETFRSLAQHCSLLEAMHGYRTEPESSVLHGFLSQCRNLGRLEVSGISTPESINKMAELPFLRSLRLELFSNHQDMIDAICNLKVETLFLEFTSREEEDDDDEDDDEDSVELCLDLCTNPQDLAESFGKSSATCLSLLAGGVDPVVLQAVGSRLYELGPGRSGGEEYPAPGILGTLLQVPSSCVNLVQLQVNFWEQIDAAALATVAEMCPSLKQLRLNADDYDFQKAPIDEGVLALGRHCSRLEHLESWCRISCLRAFFPKRFQ